MVSEHSLGMNLNVAWVHRNNLFGRINVVVPLESLMVENKGNESPNRDQDQPNSRFNAKEIL